MAGLIVDCPRGEFSIYSRPNRFTGNRSDLVGCKATARKPMPRITPEVHSATHPASPKVGELSIIPIGSDSNPKAINGIASNRKALIGLQRRMASMMIWSARSESRT